MKRSTLFPICTLSAAIAASTGAYAQSASDDRTLEEVIVSAQKISENLQDVPISVSVATEQDIKDINAYSFEDLEEITPGVAFGGGAGLQSAAIRVRGVGPEFFALGIPPNVAVFVDQVAQAQIGAVFTTLVDVAQVELLLGPQGTLYGRNAPGGAYNISTKRPNFDGLNGYIEGSYSAFESTDLATTDVRGALNVPLIDDVLAWRLAAVYSDSDGHVRLPRVDDTTGGHQNDAIRSRMLWKPNSDMEVLWTVNYQDLETNPAGFNYDGQIPGTGGSHATPRMFNDFKDNRNWGERPSLVTGEVNDTSLHWYWDTGSFDLDVIGYYQEFNTFSDEVRAPYFTDEPQKFFIGADTEITTFEVRISDTTDSYDYVAGLYYFDSSSDFFNNILVQGVNVNGTGGSGTDGYAAFSNFTFHLNDKWDLAVGLRYDDVSDDIDTATTFSGVTAALTDEHSFDHLSWSVKLNNFIHDDLTAYLAIDHAYKQGGFNGLVAGVTALNQTFGLPIPPAAAIAAEQTIDYDEETSDAIELGIKGTFLDKRLSLSAAIFYQRYEDHHLAQTNQSIDAIGPIFGSFFLAAVDNAEEVETKGVEFNATYLIGNHWDTSVRLAYSDPSIGEWSTRFCPSGENDRPDQLYCPQGDGDSLNSLPNWKTNIQLGYKRPLEGAWELYSRLNWSWQDEPSDTRLTDEYAETKDQIGFTLGISNQASGLDIKAWGKNLGNSDKNVNPGRQVNRDPSQPFAYQGSFTPGREFGVTVRYEF